MPGYDDSTKKNLTTCDNYTVANGETGPAWSWLALAPARSVQTVDTSRAERFVLFGHANLFGSEPNIRTDQRTRGTIPDLRE